MYSRFGSTDLQISTSFHRPPLFHSKVSRKSQGRIPLFPKNGVTFFSFSFFFKVERPWPRFFVVPLAILFRIRYICNLERPWVVAVGRSTRFTNRVVRFAKTKDFTRGDVKNCRVSKMRRVIVARDPYGTVFFFCWSSYDGKRNFFKFLYTRWKSLVKKKKKKLEYQFPLCRSAESYYYSRVCRQSTARFLGIPSRFLERNLS